MCALLYARAITLIGASNVLALSWESEVRTSFVCVYAWGYWNVGLFWGKRRESETVVWGVVFSIGDDPKKEQSAMYLTYGWFNLNIDLFFIRAQINESQ